MFLVTEWAADHLDPAGKEGLGTIDIELDRKTTFCEGTDKPVGTKLTYLLDSGRWRKGSAVRPLGKI